MDCKKAERYLVDYLYRELSAKKTLEVEKHLQVCDRCAQTLESWQTIHATYQKSAIEPQVSPYLKQRVLSAAEEALAQKPTLGERMFALLRPMIVVPVVLLGLFAVLYYTTQKGANVEIARKIVPARAPVLLNKHESLKLQEAAKQRGADQLKSFGYTNGGELERDKMESLSKVQAAPKYDDMKRAQLANEESKQKAGDYRLDAGLTGNKDREKEEAGRQPEATETATPPSAEPPPPVNQAAPAEAPAPTTAEKSAPISEAKKSMTEYNQLLSNANASFQEAQVLFQANNLKGGWNTAQQAIAQDQGKSLASQFHQYGILYQNNREYDKAIVQFKLILTNYENYNSREDVLLRLAESYTELGRFDEAQNLYQQILHVSPQNKTVLQKLMELRKKQDAQKQLHSLESQEKQK